MTGLFGPEEIVWLRSQLIIKKPENAGTDVTA